MMDTDVVRELSPVSGMLRDEMTDSRCRLRGNRVSSGYFAGDRYARRSDETRDAVLMGNNPAANLSISVPTNSAVPGCFLHPMLTLLMIWHDPGKWKHGNVVLGIPHWPSDGKGR